MSDRGTNATPRQQIASEDAHLRVSVIIPVFDASAYIAATLESVFQQTFSSYEVIVINDGSSDTPELETALRPYLSRMHYFRQENRGPSAARNVGIRMARGRYIALLDSDDIWLPHHLARQIDILVRNSDLGLVYSDSIQFRNGKAVGPAFERVPQSGTVTLDSLLAEDCTVNTSSVVVRRDAILNAGLFDEDLRRCEDFDLWLRLAAAGVRMTYDREIHVLHRLGNGLASNSQRMKRARADVYRRAAATLALNEAQQRIVRGKLKDLEVETEIEAAKEYLEAGRFREAGIALQRVNSRAPSLKLWLAEAGLRFCPALMRWFYRRYTQFLRWYKVRNAGSTPGSGSVPPDFDRLMREPLAR